MFVPLQPIITGKINCKNRDLKIEALSDCVVLVEAVEDAVGFGFHNSLVPQFEKEKKWISK